MGDKAEKTFEQVFPRHNRIGLNRPDMNVSKMTLLSRTIPDYQTETALVEVMGIGRDATLKLKAEKALALIQWQFIDPVELFVADSYKRRWWRAPLDSWLTACFQHATVDHFPDNNKLFWRLHVDHFPVDPTPSPRT
jgi:hypothetical protein